jgi:hypothetical protein
MEVGDMSKELVCNCASYSHVYSRHKEGLCPSSGGINRLIMIVNGWVQKGLEIVKG